MSPDASPGARPHMTPAQIRPATPDDSEAIAALQVTAWREAYRGLLPDAALDKLSMPDQTIMWQRILDRRPAIRIFIAESPTGDAVGFASGGPRRDAALAQDGEVYTLYVLRRAQLQGLGRRLMQTVGQALFDASAKSFGLWVLRDNAGARQFYERLGGQRSVERIDRAYGVELAEVAYVWTDLARFLDTSLPSR